MKMIKPLVTALVMSAVLSSCSFIPMMFPPNLSRQDPYKAYIGKTVYLTDGDPLWVEGGFSDDYPHRITRFDPQGCGTFERISLKKGQPFFFEKAQHRLGAGVSVVELFGRVEVKGIEYKVSVPAGNYQYRFEQLPFTNAPN